MKSINKISICLMFLLLLLSTGFYADISSAQNYEYTNPLNYWEKGSELVDKGQYDEAIDNFSKAIKLNKGEITTENIANIYHSRGLAYLRKEQFKEAIEDFNNAIKINSKKPEVYNSLGLAYSMMNKYDAAMQYYDKAIELNSKSAAYYQNRGSTYSKMQDYNKALEDFSKAIALDPKSTGPYIGRGVVYKNKQMFNDALGEFNSVLDMYPGNYLATFHKACVFSLMNKVDEACKLLESAVRDGANRWPAMKNNIRNNPDFDNIRNSACFKKIASE